MRFKIMWPFDACIFGQIAKSKIKKKSANNLQFFIGLSMFFFMFNLLTSLKPCSTISY